MICAVNETHDAGLRSWVETANEPGADFPIQNLPYGVFCDPPLKPAPRIGVAIGDRILDLSVAAEKGLLNGLDAAVVEACRQEALNELMSLGPQRWMELRRRVSGLLAAGSAEAWKVAGAFTARKDAAMTMPARIGDYTDFYASVHHATNVGKLYRPDNPLLPNYKWMPIGYHGRASSVVVSGTAVRRPKGQTGGSAEQAPVFGAAKALDYELEVGFFVGPGNALGEAVTMEQAEERIFGVCLLNDWSARDIQRWEYQPLGPFLGKSFATTISPWVVTMEALAPFRAAAYERPEGDPKPLAYLSLEEDRERGAIDMTLEARLRTERMREAGEAAMLVSRSNARGLYWTAAQMVAHHASNGCNLRPGDLLGSGTVSGEGVEERGCLLEITGGGEPLRLPDGETRRFLEDGDEVEFRAYCEREGAVRIGFGDCRGRVTPAA